MAKVQIVGQIYKDIDMNYAILVFVISSWFMLIQVAIKANDILERLP